MKRINDKEFELIGKIKEGDTSKFRLLVEKYKDVSFSLACSVLVNEQDAEDALQESFIKAYNGLGNFKFNSSFSTWFYRIVVNTCMTKYQNRTRQRKVVQPSQETDPDISDNNSLFSEIVKSEREDFVNRALDALKRDESLLLRLYYLAGLSISEIKQITGFKDSKIKVTLHRARKSLSELVENSYGKEFRIS